MADHPSVTASAIPPASGGHWEGEYWVDGDYRVHRKWCDHYPQYYGPCAIDPDHGQGDIELDDALAKALAKIDGYGGVGSTSGERHCFQAAFLLAHNFVESSADIPPVPKFWLDEAHYWMSGITAGRLLKKQKTAEQKQEVAETALETLTTWGGLIWSNKETRAKVAGLVTSALVAGGIAIPPLVQAILNFMGAT